MDSKTWTMILTREIFHFICIVHCFYPRYYYKRSVLIIVLFRMKYGEETNAAWTQYESGN